MSRSDNPYNWLTSNGQWNSWNDGYDDYVNGINNPPKKINLAKAYKEGRERARYDSGGTQWSNEEE